MSELVAISRKEQRAKVISDSHLDFLGVDVWRTSELTWLDLRGKPHRANTTISVPCDSPFMVESKSLKLYLTSMAMREFRSRTEIQQEIQGELCKTLESSVSVELLTAQQGFGFDEAYVKTSHNLDYIPLRRPKLTVDSTLLDPSASTRRASGRYHTDLFRCLCPITSQPDYATIVITFENAILSGESLLSYLVSYRVHQGYHESTIERIFSDILTKCSPENLTVLGSFSRRGGIDICPIRSSQGIDAPNWRSALS